MVLKSLISGPRAYLLYVMVHFQCCISTNCLQDSDWISAMSYLIYAVYHKISWCIRMYMQCMFRNSNVS